MKLLGGSWCLRIADSYEVGGFVHCWQASAIGVSVKRDITVFTFNLVIFCECIMNKPRPKCKKISKLNVLIKINIKYTVFPQVLNFKGCPASLLFFKKCPSAIILTTSGGVFWGTQHCNRRSIVLIPPPCIFRTDFR